MAARQWMFAAVVGAAILTAAIATPVEASQSSAARERSDKIVAEAEVLINQAGRSDPLDTEKVRRAIDKLRDALAVDPRNDSAYVDLGFSYGLLRDPSTAVDMYVKATQINPSPANYKELADIYLRVGDPASALMAANGGLIKNPKDAKLQNAKGMALLDLARPDEAAIAFRKAVELDPTFTVARDNLRAVNERAAHHASGGAQRGSN
ncbi:MAG TPA: tetratricopeptide repeat protein [Candidatus Binataceae bacterium]|nr:tetratricopeptide repeat protein [Candidatus Binataceae bacterium]